MIFKDEPGGPGAFFNQLSEFTQIFGSTIYVAQTLVGDSVVVRGSCALYDREAQMIVLALSMLPCLEQAYQRRSFPISSAPRQHR